MGREISLFSGYDQKENRTTNYCLLMLRQVYEASPKLLALALERMIGGDVRDRVGVNFRQQERAGGSVPDGLIQQKGFSIFIETKNWDWFYWDQIREHLKSLQSSGEGLKVLIALANFESKDDEKFLEFARQARDEIGDDVRFAALSFEEFILALEDIDLPLQLQSTRDEFRAYLDGEGLLRTWRQLFEVVNCVSTMHEVDAGAYLCPATPGSYWHSRARYFGPYRWKSVDRVCEIAGVVDVFPVATKIHWNNSPLTDNEVISQATRVVDQFRPMDKPDGVRAIVLGELHSTQFIKDSKGGLFGTKRYFTVPEMEPAELAEYLRGKTWTDLRGY